MFILIKYFRNDFIFYSPGKILRLVDFNFYKKNSQLKYISIDEIAQINSKEKRKCTF